MTAPGSADAQIRTPVITVSQDPGPSLHCSSRAAFVLLSGAAAIVVALVFVAQRDEPGTRTAEQPTAVAPAPVPQVSFAEACTDLVEATSPFADFVESVEPTDPALLTGALATWTIELDRFAERTAEAAQREGIDDPFGPLRVRIRQAESSTDRQTLVAIDREWRNLTGEGSPLDACGS